MLLKKITTNQNGTTDIDFIMLTNSFRITRPDPNGSFSDRVFGFGDEAPDPGVVVVIDNIDCDYKPIFIFEDQEAFIIGDDGNTIMILNKHKSFKVWYRDKTKSEWTNLDDCNEVDLKIQYAKNRGVSLPGLEFITLKEGVNPNNMIPNNNKNTITWIRNIKGTASTWRPSNQLDIELYSKDPNYQFIKCPSGINPN